ncbi:hypothetical protein ACK39T_12205 [Aeromonas veronii]
MTIEYKVTPSYIFNESKSAAADRIVFAIGKERIVSIVDLDEISNLFKDREADLSNFKYKLQKRVDNKFIDINTYNRIINVKEIRAKLKKVQVDEGGFPNELVSDVLIYTDLDLVSLFLRRLLAGFLRRQYQKFDSSVLEKYDNYVSSISESLKTNVNISYFYFYIKQFKIIAAEINNNSECKYQDIYTKLKDIDNVENSGFYLAKQQILGQIASLFDRDLAFLHFEKAKTRNYTIFSNFYVDMGVYTYKSASLVEGNAQLKNKPLFDTHIETDYKNSISISMSLDSNFLKIYGSQIAHYIINFPKYDFNLTVVTLGDNCKTTTVKFIDLLNSLSEFSHGGRPENYSITFTALPDWVANKKTYFACARFLAAEKLINKYQSTYIMDADLTWLEDPHNYFKELKKIGPSVPFSRGTSILPPWRRYMAGNVYLNSSKSSIDFLENINKYILNGLAECNSWMLDQNAITYAIEKAENNKINDLGRIFRPFNQLSIRTVFEKNVFECN